MSDAPAKSHVIRAAQIAAAPEVPFRHPLNPRSEIFFRAFGRDSLSDAAGLSRIGVHVVRIPPGRESFAKHSHQREEEFIYVLEGSGVVELDAEVHAIAAGDFVAFPAPGPAHIVRNDGALDLVLLMGGERVPDVEIAYFPDHGKRMVRVGAAARLVEDAAFQEYFPTEG